MIRVKCPECEKTLGLDDAKAGKSVTCPSCQNQIKVPKNAKTTAAASTGKPSKPKKVRPGEEEDDFDPYAVQKDDAPKLEDESERVDEMVRHHEKMRLRNRAWDTVGPAAKIMKIIGLIACLTYVATFAWMFTTVVLWEHQLTLEAKGEKSANKGGAKPLYPLEEFLPSRNSAGLNHWGVAGLFFGIMVFGLTWNGLVIAGAEKMKKLESYGLAMTGSILMLLEMPPVGLMAILALRNPQVIKEFEESNKRKKRVEKMF